MAKLESCNPGGSGKDRAAKNMLKQAIRKNLLVKNKGVYHIVEGTSGSTGISLAYICASLGPRTGEDCKNCEWNHYSMNKYQLHVVLPDDQAKEKTQLLEKLGVHVVLVPTAAISNPHHYVHTARRLAEDLQGYFINQFENLDNFGVHYEETGPELWNQCCALMGSADSRSGGGSIGKPPLDMFVMSAGTGGTIAGISRFLKSQNSAVRVVLADPQGSSLFNKVKFGVCYTGQQKEQGVRKHRYDSIVEGVGLDRVTANFARAVTNTKSDVAADAAAADGASGTGAGIDVGHSIDDAVSVSDQEIVDMAHFVLQREGLLIGSSSALNLSAACYAARERFQGHAHQGQAPVVVTILCDQGSRHLSRFWNAEFVASAPYSLQWPGHGSTASDANTNTGVMPACLRVYSKDGL